MATGLGVGMAYDPVGRLFNIGADQGLNTTFLYDGANTLAETDQNSGALLRRYVYGPGTDEPIVWYEGAGTSDRRWLHADERGSIVAISDGNGNVTSVNSYDEYGVPGSGNAGRFQYTGQMWLPAVGIYSYKARMYSPTLGRFMQTDPIGYADGLNWYNYAGGDPVNNLDPSGLDCSGASFGSYDDGVYPASAFPCNVTGDPLNGLIPGGAPADITSGSPASDGWGKSSVGPFFSSNQVALPQKRDPICTGPYVTGSVGGSFTAAAMVGINLSVSLNFSHPTSVDWSNPLKGFQVSGSLQGAWMFGPYGLFVGGGVTGGGGLSSGPAPTGVSTSSSYYAEGDIGAGAAYGGSVQVNRPIGSGVSGAVGTKYGGGVGVYAGAGKAGTVTYASRPIGC